MSNTSHIVLALGLTLAGLGLSCHEAAADQTRKKPRAATAATAASSAAPSRANDLNSPATDFSSVAPVIDDPQAERLKPKKKRDANFD